MKKTIIEKRIPVHGRAGIAEIIGFACQTQKQGTCDGANLNSGSAQYVFGRLANMVPLDHQPSIKQLGELARLMQEDEKDPKNGSADAGIAYLGQFIDHDITLDATTMLGQVSGDVQKIRNFRTPTLDLDSVYGDGPEVDPWLYENDNRLIFGFESDSGGNKLDLQRNSRGRALIGDPRNDENLFVSQIHGRQFVDRHNQIIKELIDQGGDDKEDNLKEARACLTKEYHNRIVHEFLPAIVHDSIYVPMVEQAKNGRLEDVGMIEWAKAPAMPVEFSAAAYRFGHSMIREFYTLNSNQGREKVRIFSKEKDAIKLHGFSPVDKENNLDFDLFFGKHAQKASPIDTQLPAALLSLPDEIAKKDKNLAARNMIRGQHTFKLPSGEKMAEYMDASIINADDKIKSKNVNLEGNTPLWYYVLSEAEQYDGKLGPVGGGLVAGVILNMLIRSSSPALRPYRGV